MPKLLVRSLLWLCLVLAFARCSGETVTSLGPSDRPVRRTYTFTLDVPPRLQWNENSGYCGETSFICAGLYFGQYCSQFTAREMASPGVPQSDPSSQLLLGVNDRRAAEMMRLQTIEFDSRAQRSTDELLAWVKRQALAGHIVIIGVFNNGIILGEWTSVQDGDSEYDHIGPVLGIKSNEPLDSRPGEYLPEDELTFCDNGLFGPSIGSPPTMYQFLFPYTFKSFPGTRVEANNPNGPIYMLKNTPPNYGVAVTGVVDPDRVTVPVRLRSSSDTEPQIDHHSNVPPEPVPITLTATVSLPDPEASYNLYQYDRFEKVPTTGFNAAAGNAARVWTIPAGSGEEFTVKLDVLSDQTVIFRAVPSTAP